MIFRDAIRYVFVALLIGGTALLAPESQAQRRVLALGWNVENSGNEAVVIARQLAAFEGYDLLGLCELSAASASLYALAAAVGEGAQGRRSTFDFRLGSSGGSRRMAIIWDEDRLTLVGEPVEIDSLNEGNHRAPLFARFRLEGTDEEFFFMVNHLARGNAALRRRQAAGISAWAAQQIIPVIAVGDYNFDYSIDDGVGNDGMDAFLAPGVFRWVRPAELFRTNASSRFNGVLDFVFIANQPAHWSVDSKILLTLFPDDEETSDHRPVQGRILIAEDG